MALLAKEVLAIQQSRLRRLMSSELGPPVQIIPESASSDIELVQRVLDGDSWAEEAIYRRYAAVVLGTARRLLADHEEARDVVQDTFVDAFSSWGTLRDASRLKQWLLQIAVRRVHRRFRRRRVLRLLGIVVVRQDATLDELTSSDCPPEIRAELGAIARGLEQVSPRARIAWMLRHVEGYTLQEVAEQCECSLATAKRWIGDAEAQVNRVVSGRVT